MVRNAKIALVISVALQGFIGAMGNLLDWAQAKGAVSLVTSMSDFEGGSSDWRATTSPAVAWLGVLYIMLSMVAVGILCGMGAYRMWQMRSVSANEFTSAKAHALVGCAVGIIMLYGGFMIIAESWFELWRSLGPIRMGLLDAFRYAAMMALIAIFVAMCAPAEKPVTTIFFKFRL